MFTHKSVILSEVRHGSIVRNEVEGPRRVSCRHNLPHLFNPVRSSALLALLIAFTACRPAHIPPTPDDLARTYVSLAIQLGARDPDSLDFYSGPSIQNLEDHPETLATLNREAKELRERLDHPLDADATRLSFLKAQTDAIILRTNELQGKVHSFDEESRMYFGVVAPPDTEADTRKQVRAKLAKLLGYPDSKALPSAYSRFDSQFLVQPERVPAVMTEALTQCRAITLQHLALPAGESVEVQYVSHKPWSAFSRYRGHAHSLIQVNMDYPLTVDRILNLACHEGYPGHHVFNSIRDQTLTRDRPEFQVQPTFSPQSYVSEAAAAYAPTLALSDPNRLRIERDILAPLASLKPLDFTKYLEVQRLVAALHTAEPQIARRYLDGDLEFVRAAAALERETLMLHAETALLYFNEFRTYILTYTVGADSVQALVKAGHPTEAERWRRYSALMTSPVASLPPPSP